MSLKQILLVAGLAALAACSGNGPTNPLCIPNPDTGQIDCAVADTAVDSIGS